jgi:hypothetical protein
MWGSKGRSGYGDSTIGGDYDSWDGVSPNGRQYKNEATMETRDLSGADYWHLRKQNRPTEEIPAELHMLKNGKANINAYADPVTTKKASTVSIKDKILPQAKRLTTLREQMIELETSYRAGEMSISEYSLLRDIIVAKIQRQEVLYKRAASVKPKSQETDEDSAQDGAEYTPSSGFSPQPDDGYASEELEAVGVVWVDELSSTNSLKNILKKACVVCRTLVRWHQASKRYIQTLKEV